MTMAKTKKNKKAKGEDSNPKETIIVHSESPEEETPKTKKKGKNKLKNTEENETNQMHPEAETHDNSNQETKKKRKNKNKQTEDQEDTKEKGVTFASDVVDNEPESEESPKKKKKIDELRLPTEEEISESAKPQNVKNINSIRQQKREKHAKLLAENKLKSEALTQQKALNYLSLWKHNRAEWKFEKLRQGWIQSHMFDSVLVPDEFWDTVVEYFGGAKGGIRQLLIDECMKIMEEAEKSEEKSENEVSDTKFSRARTLLQFLQE